MRSSIGSRAVGSCGCRIVRMEYFNDRRLAFEALGLDG
jgi:hypothetical protein